MADTRSEHRQHLITEMKRMIHLEASKVAGLRAELDVSLVEEVSSLIQSTRENLYTVLAALNTEVVRTRESSEKSAQALNCFTGILALATVVLAAATVALVFATLKLAKA